MESGWGSVVGTRDERKKDSDMYIPGLPVMKKNRFNASIYRLREVFEPFKGGDLKSHTDSHLAAEKEEEFSSKGHIEEHIPGGVRRLNENSNPPAMRGRTEVSGSGEDIK